MNKSTGAKIILFLTVIAILIFLQGVFNGSIFRRFFKPTDSTIPVGVTLDDMAKNDKGDSNTTEVKDVEIISRNLEIPWDVAFLPGGDLLVTERGGQVLRIGTDTKVITKINGVEHKGEGGLLGIALHPDFENNKFIYLYFTSTVSGNLENKVERYKLEGDNLTNRETIIDGIAGAPNHDGGRIEFGPDGYLYIATGDAQESGSAQDRSSLSGKILRVTDNGEAAPENPFGNEVYTFGHRNPQGLAWDNEGNLWSTEHGPSGTQTGNDEINLIKVGNNYGWPNFVGWQKGEGITSPVLESGKSDTWAPASLAYYNGSLFFGGLRGEALYQAIIFNNDELQLVSHFIGEFGRIRTVDLGPDNLLYLTTSNKDGRGNPSEDDDKIIKINPEIFFR